MTFPFKFLTTVFLFVFVLLCASNAYSQQENGVVSLQKQTAKTILKDYYIADFIDARDEKNVIGIKTGKNHDYYWFFAENAQKELAVCTGNSSVISTKKAVTLRLNRLWLSKASVDDFEKAIAALSFTFLEKQTDGSYLELATISKKAEKNYGGGKEDGFYAQAIASAVEQILQSFNTQTKQQINVAAAKIAENPFSNLGNLPIFNTPPKRGLFMTLESLQQNNPDTVQQFMLKPVYQNLDLQSQKKLLYYEIKTPQNKYLKDYPIAFCDGKDVYAAVYKPEEYKLLIDDSNAFYVASLAVENFTKSDRKRNGVGAAASLLFLGVAAIPIIIGTAIANKEGGAEKKAEATDREFDITTGTVQDYPTQKKYENQLLFVYPNNQIDSVSLLTIKIDGKQIVQLSPRSYYIYSMKAEGKPVKITYEYKNEARVFEQSMYSTEINSFVFGFGGTDKRSLYRRDDIVQKPDRDYDFVYQELIVKKKYRLIK